MPEEYGTKTSTIRAEREKMTGFLSSVLDASATGFPLFSDDEAGGDGAPATLSPLRSSIGSKN